MCARQSKRTLTVLDLTVRPCPADRFRSSGSGNDFHFLSLQLHAQHTRNKAKGWAKKTCRRKIHQRRNQQHEHTHGHTHTRATHIKWNAQQKVHEGVNVVLEPKAEKKRNGKKQRGKPLATQPPHISPFFSHHAHGFCFGAFSCGVSVSVSVSEKKKKPSSKQVGPEKHNHKACQKQEAFSCKASKGWLVNRSLVCMCL